jgi:hypothetical protein
MYSVTVSTLRMVAWDWNMEIQKSKEYTTYVHFVGFIQQLYKDLLTSQEGLCSMELRSFISTIRHSNIKYFHKSWWWILTCRASNIYLFMYAHLYINTIFLVLVILLDNK